METSPSYDGLKVIYSPALQRCVTLTAAVKYHLASTANRISTQLRAISRARMGERKQKALQIRSAR